MKLNLQQQQFADGECEKMMNSAAGVVAVVLASQDGFELAYATSRALDPAKLAAMSSSMVAIGSVVSTEAQLGNSDAVTVNTDSGLAYVKYANFAGVTCILCVITGKDALLGQVIFHANELEKALSQF